MNILQAKKTAKHRLWTCTSLNHSNTGFYLSSDQLYSLTVEKFEQFYLNRAN